MKNDVTPRNYPVLSSFPALVLSLRALVSEVCSERLTWRSARARRGGKVAANSTGCANRSGNAGETCCNRLPTGQPSFCLGQRGEERLVEQLVAKAAVEALDEAILHRLAWSDVVPFDLALLSPGEDGVAGELTAVTHREDSEGLPAWRTAFKRQAATVGQQISTVKVLQASCGA